MHHKIRNHTTVITVTVLTALIFCQTAWGITPAEEKKMSREFMVAVMKQVQLVTDWQINDYVRQVGERVLAVLPPQPFQYRFFIIEEPTYNAFAGPGGVIFIHTGLLAAMESEDELAGIIGHEISHVTCRHISDRIERSKKIGIINLAGLAAAVALGAAGAGQAANAAMVGSMAAGQSLSLSYSREDEMQADQLGLTYLNKAGYSVVGLQKILNKIKSKRWYGPEEIPSYLLTHPAVEDRIAYIDSWLETHEAAEMNLPKRDAYEFRKTHTRTLALYGDEETARLIFENAIKSSPEDMMSQYGYGLILARSGHRNSAVAHLRKALARRAFDTDILADLGRVYFLDGDFSAAQNTLESALSTSPDHPDALFYLGRTQLKRGDIHAAVESLEHLIAEYPAYHAANLFLGEAYSKEGKSADAHYRIGVYNAQEGNFKTALAQLQKALELTRDPRQREEIENLITETRALQARLTKEKEEEKNKERKPKEPE